MIPYKQSVRYWRFKFSKFLTKGWTDRWIMGSLHSFDHFCFTLNQTSWQAIQKRSKRNVYGNFCHLNSDKYSSMRTKQHCKHRHMQPAGGVHPQYHETSYIAEYINREVCRRDQGRLIYSAKETDLKQASFGRGKTFSARIREYEHKTEKSDDTGSYARSPCMFPSILVKIHPVVFALECATDWTTDGRTHDRATVLSSKLFPVFTRNTKSNTNLSSAELHEWTIY